MILFSQNIKYIQLNVSSSFKWRRVAVKKNNWVQDELKMKQQKKTFILFEIVIITVGWLVLFRSSRSHSDDNLLDKTFLQTKNGFLRTFRALTSRVREVRFAVPQTSCNWLESASLALSHRNVALLQMLLLVRILLRSMWVNMLAEYCHMCLAVWSLQQFNKVCN